MGCSKLDIFHENKTLVMACLEQIACIPNVVKILIYGSYAKGTQTESSDLDLAVFLDSYPSELLSYYRALTQICTCPELDIQVQAFCADELDAPCGIVEEVVKYGIEFRGSGI